MCTHDCVNCTEGYCLDDDLVLPGEENAPPKVTYVYAEKPIIPKPPYRDWHDLIVRCDHE